jgi:hypothetical protein
VGIVLSFAVLLAARRKSLRSIVRWCLYSLVVTFVFGIGWSPQYELYLIPFILLAFEDPFVGAGTALALQTVTVLEYPILLPWAFFYGGSLVWVAWGVVLARYVILGWLCVEIVRREASLAGLQARIARLTGPLRRGVLVNALLCLAVGSACVQATPVPDVVVHAATPIAVASTPVAARPLAAAPVPAIAPPTPACGPNRGPGAPTQLDGRENLDWAVPDGWFFSEAAPSSAGGFSIVDDDAARMWSEFSRLGGWPALGFPVSRRFTWHGQLSQAMQRAVLQWSAVTGQVQPADVLDLLHDAGLDPDLETAAQIPPPLDLDEAGLPFDIIAANRLGWLDARPAIKARYCDAPGGADPVLLWGLPTSQAVDVGNDVYVLRTQRAAFQEWVQGAPWAAPGQVTVVLSGDLAKEFNLLPADASIPEPAPPH